MAADTAAKRYSAMNLACPWRGLNVVPDGAIPQGERQAVMWTYSGILIGAVSLPVFNIGRVPIRVELVWVAGVNLIYRTPAGIGVVPVHTVTVTVAGVVPVMEELAPGIGIINVSE